MIMEENEIEQGQKGTHEVHFSVLDYKKKVREQEVAVIKKENVFLLNVAYDMDRGVVVLGGK